MKTETVKLKSIKELLSRSDMKKIVAGSGDIGYCATSYAIRSCNSLSSGAMTGWQECWSAGSCSQYNGASLWDAAVSSGIPMSQSSCDTSWYSYKIVSIPKEGYHYGDNPPFQIFPL